MPRLWHYAVACVASTVYSTSCWILFYFVCLVVGILTSNDVGGPLAGPFLAILGFATGVALSLVVYAPASYLLARATRSRPMLRWSAPIPVLVLAAVGGIVLALFVHERDLSAAIGSRVFCVIGLPLWLGGGFCVYWAALLAIDAAQRLASRAFRF
jgi:hypothetical protein